METCSLSALPDDYRVHVAITEGREIHAVASFNKAEATEALKLLSAPPVQRWDVGQALKARIDARQPIALNGVELSRAGAMLLALSCLMHSNKLQELKQDMERIARGTAKPGDILRPTLWRDGFRPKK